MTRTGRFLTAHGLDLLVAATAVGTGLATALRDDLQHSSGPGAWFDAFAVAAVVLTLLGRHRFPFAAPAATWLGASALSFIDGQLIVDQAGLFVVGMAAAVLLGSQRGARQSYAGLAIVLVGAGIVISNVTTSSAQDHVSAPLTFGIGWLIGFALRERTQRTEVAEEQARRAERDRESAARVAVAEERGRIARELHDVVAHAMSMMLLQVGAVRHRMPEAAAADREALLNVEKAGRTALTEMRRLLSSMREEGDDPELLPHPGLADLRRLAEDVGATGLPVQVDVLGEPRPLPPGLDLSAYRIVQEGLTNSLKHSGATRAEVTVTYRPDELRLEIRDDGPRTATPSPAAGPARGHGLVGIRERVKLFGGEVSAGPAASGGFLVRARLPLGGEDG